MRRRIIVAAAAGLGAGLLLIPAQEPAVPSAALKAAAQSMPAATGAPGAAVAVVSGDRAVLPEGTGVANIDTGAPVTPDTLFQLGSLTKTLTAVAAAIAAERGLVDLDRPVVQYVLGLRPCLAAATLRQLLGHTAGLIDEPDEYGPHDESALAAGYGTADLENNVPADASTVYEIGSITKQVTAEAVMILQEEGKLRLDDPIERHLAGIPPAWSGITIRHLLTHVSGLRDWESAPEFSYRRDYTREEFIALLAKPPLDFAPGTRFAYTNSGYPLLGLIVTRVAGMPFERFVEERIFKPARMTQARFKVPGEIVPRRAAGYIERDGALRLGEPHRPAIIAPNGAIQSSAADMARWLIALEGGRIVKPATLEVMESPVRLKDGSTFSAGISWFIDSFRGRRILLHNGSTVAGFSSVVCRYPDDRLSVVVLFNIDRWNAVNVLATKIANVFVPGLSVMNLPEQADPDPAMSARLLRMLDDVAQGRDSETLAPPLRNPGGARRANRAFGFSGRPDRFAFLDREDFGAEGRERFGTVIRWICRHKLVSGARAIYYTFDVTPEGKVARFFPEEE